MMVWADLFQGGSQTNKKENKLESKSDAMAQTVPSNALLLILFPPENLTGLSRAGPPVSFFDLPQIQRLLVGFNSHHLRLYL